MDGSDGVVLQCQHREIHTSSNLHGISTECCYIILSDDQSWLMTIPGARPSCWNFMAMGLKVVPGKTETTKPDWSSQVDGSMEDVLLEETNIKKNVTCKSHNMSFSRVTTIDMCLGVSHGCLHPTFQVSGLLQRSSDKTRPTPRRFRRVRRFKKEDFPALAAPTT